MKDVKLTCPKCGFSATVGSKCPRCGTIVNSCQGCSGNCLKCSSTSQIKEINQKQ